jgi:hypothetical protein
LAATAVHEKRAVIQEESAGIEERGLVPPINPHLLVRQRLLGTEQLTLN